MVGLGLRSLPLRPLPRVAQRAKDAGRGLAPIAASARRALLLLLLRNNTTVRASLETNTLLLLLWLLLILLLLHVHHKARRGRVAPCEGRWRGEGRG